MEAVTRMATGAAGDVLASAAAGDELAFRRIIAEHHEDMRRVCLAISGDHAIAEDAVQAAWLVAWKKLDRVHGPDQLRPWLVSVAARETRQLLRRRRRRVRVEIAGDSTERPGGVDPASGISTVDLRAALMRLDPDDRALLAMRYGAGFTSSELAMATGISASGTRSRIERLLKRLREDLRDG
jgi:RNA polymerase sigma-70 factor (ECF subfamily)